MLVVAITAFLAISCTGPEVLDDLGGSSFDLVNQDGVPVEFPVDYAGSIQVISFIYTHCPDVCPVITANMSNINRQLEDTAGVHFIEITFDPERDTPSVLKNYLEAYKLNPRQFTMLTGQPAEVDSLLDRLGIFVQKTDADTLSDGEITYFMNHSNRILLMDGQGRIRGRYNGSRVPPEHVIEDINKLR